MPEEQLIINNLSIRTNSGKQLVHNVNLEMFQGDFIGIVGESGSGKTISTLATIDVLSSNLKTTTDKHQLLGHNVNEMKHRELRKLVGSQVGYIPQNTVAYLHPMIKIKNQMIDGYLKNIENNKKSAQTKAKELLKRVGIQDSKRVMDLYPFEISGGMKQRVNIAMALMTSPKILIADEPTTALDTVVQRQVMDLLQELNQQGVSILFVSHDLNIVKQYCRKMYVMTNGKVVEYGDVSDVINDPKENFTKELLSYIPVLKRKRGKIVNESKEETINRSKKYS